MGRKTNLKQFGLIGKRLDYSFSKNYFETKFKALNLPHSYTNFEFESETDLADFLIDEVYKLNGFNITIPYKEIIIPYLDRLDKTADETQAVNTVVVQKGTLTGYNTDIHGFSKSIEPLLSNHKTALVLGTGGASKAIVYALKKLGIHSQLVSRTPASNQLTYQDLDKNIMEKHTVIINTTPLGTSPKTEEAPNIPYQHITESHLFFDLVYNPSLTKFLRLAQEHNAKIQNGLAMLEFQADKAWSLWNTEH